MSVIIFIVVSHTGKVYALKPPADPEKLTQFFLDYHSENPSLEDQIEADKNFDRSVHIQSSQRKKEKMFLELIKETETKMYEYNTYTDTWDQVVGS